MERPTLTRIATRRLVVGLVVLCAAAVAVPAAVAAGGAFGDDDNSIFEADIDWMADTGVTRGCNPPANDEYCPGEHVTRGQMAAFMRRFAQFLGTEDGVVDRAATADAADLLDGYEAADLTQVVWCRDLVEHEGVDVECTMTLDVAVEGVVAVNGSAEIWSTAPGWDLVSCDIRLDGASIYGSRRDVMVDHDDGTRENNCATNAGFEVDPGTHSLTFRVFEVNPGTGTHIKDVFVNGVFSPFGGSGGIL